MIPFTVAVYLFQAKNMIWLSILTEFFTTYVFSSGCKKPKEQHIHDHVCTYHSKNYQHSMRDVTQPTNNTAHVTDPNNAQPPRHGVIKRTIGGSLARSWPPPLPGRRRCCVLLLLLLGLSAAAAADYRCAVVASSAVCEVLRLSCTLCVHTARLVRSRTSMRSHQGTIK